MNDLWICPNAGECGGEKHCDHSRPHPEKLPCATPHCQHSESAITCVPYKELQVGDLVRIVNPKTLGDKFNEGEMCEIIEVRRANCRLRSMSRTNEKWHVKPENFKLITEEDMKTEAKYQTIKMIRASQLYEQHKHECPEFFTHFASLLHDLKPSHIDGYFKQDSFISWAEQDPRRIKWLLEKGYIKEVKISAYDYWVNECPCEPKGPNQNVSFLPDHYIEWAKRYPGEE